MSLTVNARILLRPTTGVQRYTREILDAWPRDAVEAIRPRRDLQGLAAHAWEQMVLPRKVKGLLWSPSNSGPLGVSRQVLTIHDMAYFDRAEALNARAVQFYRFLLPRLMPRLRHVITISAFTKERILRYFPTAEDKISVIPNGVSPRFRPHSQQDVEAMRRRLGLPDGPYVLSLSSLQPYKNIPRLIRAWEKMESADGPKATLVLAGAQGNPGHFAALNLGRLPSSVHFTGHVDDADLPCLVAGAQIMVSVSLYEGFGLPALEAMACGVPVIVSRETSLDEVVGDAGLSVDPTREEEIAEALVTLLADEQGREDLRRRGLRRATHFQWTATAQRTYETLKAAA